MPRNQIEFDPTTVSPQRAARLIGGGLLLLIICIVGLFMAFTMFENVTANEIAVVQSRWSGKLTWYTQPGMICQCLGKLTLYDKRRNYTTDQLVRFNDGGHGTLKGLSVQWEMPLDPQHLNDLHSNFGSPQAIEKSLIEPLVVKSVYLTGPLMSSRESYAEKRSYLVTYVEDQVAHGLYKTVQREAETEDPLTKAIKTTMVVDIVQRNGSPDRAETSPLERFGIRTSNVAFKSLDYDDQVEKQIQTQQEIAMSVQTAIANARKAEQDKLTIELRGQANAAEAKWKQEVAKATAVTAAEQDKAVAVTAAEKERAVAELKVKTADLYKQEQTLRGEADAAYKRAVLNADGALSAKLTTFERVNQMWATAFKDHGNALVPTVVMGGGSGGNAMNSTQTIMDLVATKMATDLGLSMKPTLSPAHTTGGQKPKP